MQGCYSPQLRSGNKPSSSFRNSGAYTSPGTPEYGDNNGLGFQKGWCSERVPLSNSSRRHISAAALMPFNSGRTLPSKWDDAERWITSPVSGFGVCKTVAPQQVQRRPKAKSGPLGGSGSGSGSGTGTPPGVAYFSSYSPAVPVLEGGRARNFLAGSPLTTGVLVPDRMVQSGNVPGWSELLMESSYPGFQDEKNDEDGVSRVVSRRDMATQMSPVSSPETSPPVKPWGRHSARLEVRDVQVDKGATMVKQSKRHRIKMKDNRSPEANDLDLTWDSAKGAMKLSKLQKEEARITAWENLQNAKAEASIRKLEMKLEKKKSESMDKILSKHRAAQIKAQELRRNISEDASPRNSHQFRSLRRHIKNSLRGCFSGRNF